ncbi:MAG TPA: hypothetical protein VFA56_00295 [Gaiellaceae bacterium]|nr:hypothetical protein [Gaiellaceae bacterium]
MQHLDSDPFMDTINRILGAHGVDAVKRIDAQDLESIDRAFHDSWVAGLKEVLAFVQATLEKAERSH